MAKIAVLGTGRMGGALAGAFLSKDHDVSVWNRTPARARPLEELGARLAGSVLDAVSGSELTVSILSDYHASDLQLHAAEVAAALRGKTLLQLASGSPSEARSAAAWAREHGVRYLDGAIMATPELIGKPESTILYAGEGALFEQHRALLELLAGTTAHVGDDHGQAAALDSSLLVYMWGVLFGALHGVAISQAEGIPLEQYLAFTKGLLPVTDAFTIDLIERAITQRYGDTQATLDTHYGALQHVLEICQQRGLDRTIPDAFDKLMKRGRDRELGGLDFTALLQLMK
ncbi:MAG TPA: NAD(P)-binding domain-containing protein [Polyangiales bacterium]|nr:NAD(P)-binding domain-containing protein [Polyangiales bacterium]